MTDTLHRLPSAGGPDPDDGEHPRLLRRRHQVHRDRSDRRRRRVRALLSAVLAVVVLLGAVAVVAFSDFGHCCNWRIDRNRGIERRDA